MACSRGCCETQAAHYRSIEISATFRTVDPDVKFAKDNAAYRTLRKQGYQPKTIAGASDAQNRAASKWELETGQLLANNDARKITEEVVEALK